MQSISVLPLHGGKAPRWLFSRMVKLSGLIANYITDEFGTKELIKRLADPYWFQAFACAIGYDWHSSGATTVTLGALKEAMNNKSEIYVAGGKGREGLATPEQITRGTESFSISGLCDDFVRYSKMVAKVDSALVYDAIGIYHHAFVFSRHGEWCIVQQGMLGNYAVRFQAVHDNIDKSDITNETNTGICSSFSTQTIDLTALSNSDIKQSSLALVNEDVQSILNSTQVYRLPDRHRIIDGIDISKRAVEMIRYANEIQPRTYEELLGIKGIGRKTLKSIALIASLIYDKEVYTRDPIAFAYNVGGKDGIPFPINLKQYDSVVHSFEDIIKSIEVNKNDEEHILRRLSNELQRAYASSLVQTSIAQ